MRVDERSSRIAQHCVFADWSGHSGRSCRARRGWPAKALGRSFLPSTFGQASDGPSTWLLRTRHALPAGPRSNRLSRPQAPQPKRLVEHADHAGIEDLLDPPSWRRHGTIFPYSARAWMICVMPLPDTGIRIHQDQIGALRHSAGESP